MTEIFTARSVEEAKEILLGVNVLLAMRAEENVSSFL